MTETALTNLQLVTIAVAQLGGHTHSVDREDIAIKVNDLAPGRFNWRKYPQNIDLDAVGVALRDAKKEKNGALLIGNNSMGWMLSPAGVEWIEQNTYRSHEVLQEQPASRRNSYLAELETECVRMRNTRAYSLYTSNRREEITARDFQQFTRVNEYFQTKARQKRYAVISNAVVNDEDLANLWQWLQNEFPQEMK